MKRIFLNTSHHGRGVFAASETRGGEEILTFLGLIVRRMGLPSPYSAKDDYYLQIGNDRFLGPSGDIDDYVNHSCDPNSGVIITGEGAKLVAIRSIQAGEQICFDYSTTMDNFGWDMDCSCGSSMCRGRIEDFLRIPKGLQDKYVKLGIVPDYILRKISASVSRITSASRRGDPRRSHTMLVDACSQL